MNEKIEPEDALDALKASARYRGIKLDESIIEAATKAPSKTTFRETLGIGSRLPGIFAGAAAALVIVGLVGGQVLNKPQSFTLELGASSNRTGALSDEVADSKMAGSFWFDPSQTEYVASDQLSTEGGEDLIYEITATMSAEELAKKIKQALSLDGEFDSVSYSADGVNGYSQEYSYLQLQNGSDYVYINDSQLLSFNYSNGEAWVTGKCLREETPPDMPESSYCVENAPVTPNLPSDSQATAEALKVFQSLGFETLASELSIHRGPDSVYITAPIKVEGRSTGLNWDISWANSGKISSINGFAVEAVPVAKVPTISAKDAVKRMSDYRWMASAGSELYNYDATSSRSVTSSDSTADEIRRLTVERATPILAIIYDAKGKAYSVPSFAMYLESDTNPLVFVSVADGVIKLPEPIVWPQDDMVEPQIEPEVTK